MLRRLTFVLMIVTLCFAIGCTPQEDTEEGEVMTTMEEAVAEMDPTQGNEANGTVTFTETDDGIRVVAHFENVPEGEHGFHIHENGDCSAPDATSAGGHFNPDSTQHAGRNAEERHVGDLGNITADENGIIHADFVDSMISFDGDHSIIGKAVILHAGEDDLTTQPTGAAGARLACGVIEMVEYSDDSGY